MYEIVGDLGRDEGSLCLGSFQLVAGTQLDGVASAQIIGQTGFAATFKELGRTTFTVGRHTQCFCHTIAHLAVALHGDTTDASCHEGCQRVLLVLQRGPCLCLAHQQVVVIGKAVALFHYGVRIVQVVLYANVRRRIVAQRVGVDVVERVGAQQVLHRLVVHTLVGSQLQAHIPVGILVQFRLQCRSQRQVQVVVVPGLNVVHSIAP